MGLPVIAGYLIKGAIVYGASKLIKKALKKKPEEAGAPPTPEAAPPEPEPAVAAPEPPPAITQTTSAATATGVAAGIRQRKRASAAGNPLFGRKPGAATATASYAPKTLVGS